MTQNKAYLQRASKTVMLLGFVLGTIAGCTAPAESEEDDLMEEEPSADAKSINDIEHETDGPADRSRIIHMMPPQKCTIPSCRKLGTPAKEEGDITTQAPPARGPAQHHSDQARDGR